VIVLKAIFLSIGHIETRTGGCFILHDIKDGRRMGGQCPPGFWNFIFCYWFFSKIMLFS